MGKEIKKTTVSKSRMKAPMNTRRTVVLDGSNIVHGGRGARSQDPDGNRLISALISAAAIEFVPTPDFDRYSARSSAKSQNPARNLQYDVKFSQVFACKLKGKQRGGGVGKKKKSNNG